MRVGLTYDLQTDAADERQVEFDPPATLDALQEAMEELGHQVMRLGSAHDLLAQPQRLGEVELVFNIAEGSHGRCREAWVPTLLEFSHVPYVGSDPLALIVALDKVMSKRVAIAEGIPTPRWMSLDHPDELPPTIPLTFPVIVKPRCEGSGRGIDAGAVVSTRRALSERVRWLFERCSEAMMIEEFIAGGELAVCMIGNTPPVAFPAIQRPLDSATRLSCHVITPAPSRWECPLELDESLDMHARRIALRMFEAVGCRDVAHVDLRVDETGRLFFLEINPLPSFDPEGSLGLLAEYLGTTYTALVGQVLNAALLRLRTTAASTHREPVLPEVRALHSNRRAMGDEQL